MSDLETDRGVRRRLMGDAGSAGSVTLPDMLVELSVVEQRYQAVLAVIRDGVPIVGRGFLT